MDFATLTPKNPRYPRRLLERMGDAAPTLYYHGPLKLLDRFTMAVIAGDSIAAQAMLATNDMLFKIREYALNYIGPWHSVMETEIFRLAIDTPTDKERRRSLTVCTARGLARENWDNFLGDRFGYKGPFTGFPQKEEFYRRAREEELLWLSITEPQLMRFLPQNIRLRNRAACALADVVFVPFAEKGNRTLTTVKHLLTNGAPVFTCQYGPDKETDVNKDLFALGIQSFTRKTIGQYLESLGARVDAPAPFPLPSLNEPVPTEKPLEPKPRIRQTMLL